MLSNKNKWESIRDIPVDEFALICIYYLIIPIPDIDTCVDIEIGNTRINSHFAVNIRYPRINSWYPISGLDPQ